MASASLHTIISGDASRFNQATEQAQASSAKFEKSLSKLEVKVASFGGGVNKFTTTFNAAKTSLGNFVPVVNKLPPALDKASVALKKVPNASNQATQSLTNLGRVVQDAPFGFLGIANNLNPLLESFQRLKATTGTTGGALKALTSSLMGAGGLGFALSLVSSALIVFGDRIFGAGAASKASEQSLGSFKNQIDRVTDSVNDLSDAVQFANQLGGINIKIRGFNELTNLREQNIAQRDATIELENQRLKLSEINQKILSDTELSNEDRVKAIEENNKAIKELDKDILSSKNISRLLGRKIELQKLEDEKEAHDKSKSEYETYVNSIISKAQSLATFFNRLTIREIDFGIDPRDTKGQTFQKALDFIDRVLNQRQTFAIKDAFLQFENVDFAFEKMNFVGGMKFTDFSKPVQEIPTEVQKEVDRLLKNSPAVQIQLKFDIKQAQIKAEIQRELDIVNGALASGIANGFSAIGEEIGNAFSGQPIGQSLINALADFLSQLGKALIAIGIAKTGLDALLADPITMPGALAIALGVVAVASAQALKNLNFGGFREKGGPVTAGKAYVVGEKGPEIWVPNSSGHIIPNNELNPALSAIGVGGGTQRIRIEGRLRSKDFRLQNARASRYERRNV